MNCSGFRGILPFMALPIRLRIDSLSSGIRSWCEAPKRVLSRLRREKQAIPLISIGAAKKYSYCGYILPLPEGKTLLASHRGANEVAFGNAWECYGMVLNELKTIIC